MFATADDWKEHMLVVKGNDASTRATLYARPENPIKKPEELEKAEFSWIRGRPLLAKLKQSQCTMILSLPQLARQGGFKIEAILDSIAVWYPGAALNLLDRLQVNFKNVSFGLEWLREGASMWHACLFWLYVSLVLYRCSGLDLPACRKRSQDRDATLLMRCSTFQLLYCNALVPGHLTHSTTSSRDRVLYGGLTRNVGCCRNVH
jgi:hypothetical protein